jgi:arsenate reductase (glutaredoxin)
LLQIIGTRKCPETRKALRLCKERGIEHQFVDLSARSLSPGEWENVFRMIQPSDLVDEQSPYFKKEGYAWREYDAFEELQLHPELLKTPLVRCKQKVVCGYDEGAIVTLGDRS